MNFIILAIIYYLFFYQKWKKAEKELIIKTVMYVYICMVLFVTIMPFPIPTGSTNKAFMESANFIPFRDFYHNYLGAKREIILNIIMMIPFGFLYPFIRNKKLVATVSLTFFFSLIIECTQLLGSYWAILHARSFDVTDLITNTFGGFVGYFIFVILKPIIRKLAIAWDSKNDKEKISKVN